MQHAMKKHVMLLDATQSCRCPRIAITPALARPGELCLYVSDDTMRSWALQPAPGQPAVGVLHRYD